jgi:YD repeat-containing protein
VRLVLFSFFSLSCFGQTYVDLSFRGAGMPLTLSRSYAGPSDKAADAGPMGIGWTHSYNVFLTADGQNVMVQLGDGHADPYRAIGSGAYQPRNHGRSISLLRNSDASFTLILQDRTKYQFSSAGRLAAIVGEGGNLQKLSYDPNGRLTMVRDASGQAFSFWYDRSDRVVSVSDTLGRCVHYEYDPAGNLISFQDALGSTTRYSYDANHRLKSATNVLGNVFSVAPAATSASGILVNLTGSQSGSTVTDSSGNYSFGGLSTGGTYTVSPSLYGYSFTPASQTVTNLSSSQTLNFTGTLAGYATVSGQVTVSGVGLSGVSILVNGSTVTSTTTDSSGNYSVVLATNGTYTLAASHLKYSFTGPVSISNFSAGQTANFAGFPVAGLEFYAVPPCRVADTRVNGGKTGAFGPPTMLAGTQRSFPVPSSSCGIPSTAAAYSLNFTVVPQGPLGVMTTWPTGQAIPEVSTLNSYSGTVAANAAIVPAGSGGSINVYVSNTTDVVFDINGYFAPPQSSGLQYYPVTPCRIADTRAGGGKNGAFGPPTMVGGTTRSFPVPSSGCGIPSTAAAYSLNFTVVPQATLGLLTTWPAGQAMPSVSTLNSYTGAVVANAAIVPAGSSGSINVYVSDTTDVLFDINGYFAAPTGSGLQFYPVTPCRVVDTRAAGGEMGPFGPPTMGALTQRSFPVPSSNCGIPSGAGAYALNFTVVPQGQLGEMATWPTGVAIPAVSTLNSYSGAVVANASIVPAGSGGAISVYVTNVTDLLFDINGYFAP